MNAIERELFLRHINIYLAEHVEEELLLTRNEATFSILALSLVGTAYITENEGIGEILLEDSDIASLWEEVLRRRGVKTEI